MVYLLRRWEQQRRRLRFTTSVVCSIPFHFIYGCNFERFVFLILTRREQCVGWHCVRVEYRFVYNFFSLYLMLIIPSSEFFFLIRYIKSNAFNEIDISHALFYITEMFTSYKSIHIKVCVFVDNKKRKEICIWLSIATVMYAIRILTV